MLTRAQRLFLDLNGYVLLRGVFAAPECAELLAIAQRLPVDERYVSESQVVRPSPAWTERRILDLALDPRLREPAAELVGGEVRLEETQFLQFPADVPGRDVLPGETRWHRGLSPDYGSFESEGHYHCLFAKVLIYLAPHGDATAVVPGSHRQRIAIGEFAKLAAPGLHMRVEAQQGDVLLFGETLIHGSPPRPYVHDRVLLAIAYCAPFMRAWSRDMAPPPRLPYALTAAEQRFVYGEARYDFREEFL